MRQWVSLNWRVFRNQFATTKNSCAIDSKQKGWYATQTNPDNRDHAGDKRNEGMKERIKSTIEKNAR
jgi:hypothetical protein